MIDKIVAFTVARRISFDHKPVTAEPVPNFYKDGWHVRITHPNGEQVTLHDDLEVEDFDRNHPVAS